MSHPRCAEICNGPAPAGLSTCLFMRKIPMACSQPTHQGQFDTGASPGRWGSSAVLCGQRLALWALGCDRHGQVTNANACSGGALQRVWVKLVSHLLGTTAGRVDEGKEATARWLSVCRSEFSCVRKPGGHLQLTGLAACCCMLTSRPACATLRAQLSLHYSPAGQKGQAVLPSASSWVALLRQPRSLDRCPFLKPPPAELA